MKTFKEFLSESNKVYAVRIKIAGDLPEAFDAGLKDCMSKYETISVKKVGATPIQEHPHEFPRLKNQEVTIYDVECSYPVGFQMLEQVLAEKFGMAQDHIKVKHPADQTEIPVETPDAARLNDLEFKDAPDAVGTLFGDEYNMNMFKELMKTRNEDVKPEGAKGEAYTMPEDDKNKSPIHTGTGIENGSASSLPKK